MTQPNFEQMSRKELRTYILEHRDDEQAFHAYMDRLANAPVLASGTLEDLQDPNRFAEILERVERIKRESRTADA